VNQRLPTRPRWTGLAALALVAGSATVISGCAQVGYLWQSTRGHLDLLAAARPVPEVLADAATPAALRERLALAQQMRDYAVRELHLPDNASYRRYADLHRPAAVWNVVAAPELSLQLKTWCFPVVGCVGYRGYYDRAAAQAEADALAAQGLEVNVYGVPAYSTLGKLPTEGFGGYFSDPLLSTFVSYPEVELARLIFHELAHQIAYAEGDTTFNESFATAVERLGSAQWLAQLQRPEWAEAAARADVRRHEFRALTLRGRAELEAVYLSHVDDASKRRRKAQVLAQLRADYAALKSGPWGGYAGYDDWFAGLNNARLGVLAAYNARVGDFEQLFERQGRDWPRFYAEVRRLAALPVAERDAALAVRPSTPRR
jgi:predicted aminopeptidase